MRTCFLDSQWSVSDGISTIGYVVLSLIHRKNRQSVMDLMGDIENMCLNTMFVGCEEKKWYSSHFVLNIIKRAVKFNRASANRI